MNIDFLKNNFVSGILTGIVLTLLVMWIKQPSNMEDCLIQNLKGIGSDQATRVLQQACRSLYGLEKE